MKQTYNVGYLQTPSVKHLANVKQTLVDSEIITHTTPNEMLPTAIKEGLKDFVKPTGTLDITENGEYDVIDKANISVNVKTNSNVGTFKSYFDEVKTAAYGFTHSPASDLSDYITYDLTSNVNDTSNMFELCKNLITIPLIDTSNVGFMMYMFSDCEKLISVPQLNTSKATKISGMFSNCSNLIEVPLLDTSNVITLSKTFSGCSKITTIPQLNTSKVTDMGYMFMSCKKLITVPPLDMNSVSNASYMFNYCSDLTNLSLLNIKINLQIGSGTSWGHLLTLDSLINICKECIKQSSKRTLTVGIANIEKLSTVTVKFTDPTIVPSETAIPTGEKGDVVVCESTDEGAMYISEYMALKNWTLA